MQATTRAARRRIQVALASLLGIGLLLSVVRVARADDGEDSSPGAVYTETNAAAGNAIAVFGRAPDGTLTARALVPTGGTGTGAGLGNEGAVLLSENGRWLLAVNAGSSDVSVFAVRPNGLHLVARAPSGGVMPISLALRGSLLYVLNAGGTNNITGFRVGRQGALTPIPSSTRPLSGPSVGPAEVSFSPDGETLVVTEKGTNTIDTYAVGSDGRAYGPMAQSSSGAVPFGFAFSKRGTLVVSEASGFVSSYEVAGNGGLTVVTASAPTYGSAPCWIAITPNGHYAYTTNAHGGTISGFAIMHDGALQLLDASGVTAVTGNGSAPLDMAVSGSGRYLHVLISGYGAVGTFRIGSDGSLVPVGMVGGLPGYASGLAAR